MVDMNPGGPDAAYEPDADPARGDRPTGPPPAASSFAVPEPPAYAPPMPAAPPPAPPAPPAAPPQQPYPGYPSYPGEPYPGQAPIAYPQGPGYGTPPPAGRRGARTAAWITAGVVLVGGGVVGAVAFSSTGSGKSNASADSSGASSTALPPAPDPATLPIGPKFTATSDPKTWPAPCDMLTSDQLRAAVPIGTPGDRVTTTNYNDFARAQVADTCQYDIHVPSGRKDVDDLLQIVSVTLYEVSDPATVASDFSQLKSQDAASPIDGTFQDTGTSFGADDSYRDGEDLWFRKGDFVVELYLMGELPTPGNPAQFQPRDAFNVQYGQAVAKFLIQRM